MLHKNPDIIAPETFVLVQQLQALPELEGFHLVGGTALALQLGHMNSIDIDLFNKESFIAENLSDVLKIHFTLRIDYAGTKTLLTHVNNIKVDFITHSYSYINPPISEDGITYLSKEDVAAMRLNVISSSGQRLKDYIDVYYLLEYFQ